MSSGITTVFGASTSTRYHPSRITTALLECEYAMPARIFSKFATVFFSLILAAPAAYGAGNPSGTLVVAQYQRLEVSPPEGNASTAPDEIREEISNSYLWNFTLDGNVMSMTGDVPAIAFQRYFAVRAQAAVTDETIVRPGAPDGFVTDALAALDAVRLLENGRAGLDGEGWYVEGVRAPDHTLDDVTNALATASTPPDQWRIAIADDIPEHAPEIQSGAGTHADPAPEIESRSSPDTELAEAPQLDSGVEARDDSEGEEAFQPTNDIPEHAPGQSAAASRIERTEALLAQPVPDYRFSAIKDEEGTISLEGHAPASLLQDVLATDGLPVRIDRVTTNSSAPEGFAPAATAGLHALALLDTGQVILRNGVWLLSGNARIDTVRDAALAILDRDSPATEWKTLILAPSSRDICRESVTRYMTGKAILFPSAGAVPTPASLDLLPGLAEHLAICPGAAVYVEGHTDADGGADANLSLSIRRAEAVVDALVALGVDPARLYAVGYGASLPIAPNTTAEGKRQNRRIVFSFEDIARPLP